MTTGCLQVNHDWSYTYIRLVRLIEVQIHWNQDLHNRMQLQCQVNPETKPVGAMSLLWYLFVVVINSLSSRIARKTVSVLGKVRKSYSPRPLRYGVSHHHAFSNISIFAKIFTQTLWKMNTSASFKSMDQGKWCRGDSAGKWTHECGMRYSESKRKA